MNILSFFCWTGCHDSAAALARDGAIIAAVEEERLSRRKHDGSVPIRSIEWCLAEAGLRMRDVDLIAFPSAPFRTGANSPLRTVSFRALRDLIRAGALRGRTLVHKTLLEAAAPLRLPPNAGLDPETASGLACVHDHFGTLPPVRYYDHHLTHAVTAYLTSGFDETAIAAIDGRGSLLATTTWRAGPAGFRRLHHEPYTNSLGFFYRDSTHYLGLGEFGAGKTMGLAAYGDPAVLRAQVAAMLDTSAAPYRYRNPPSPSLLGFPPRIHESALTPPYPDFAAAVQEALETAVARVVRSVADPAEPLCLSGGVTLNCAANGSLLRGGVAERIWIFPAAGDSGLPIGASLLAAREAGDTVAYEFTPYLGPAFSPEHCKTALRQAGLVFRRFEDISTATAERLAAGKIVGWFQGRMEIGPRALGNRSILADPRTVAMRDRVNRVKGREHWRPLAPAVVAKDAREFFELSQESPCMLFATRVRPEQRERIAAVVHVDGSARPQTVAREQNERFHDLLVAFARRTGLPVLLNTSFNAAGEPIVCSPEDAIRTYRATGLDVLVLGDFLVEKAEAAQRDLATRESQSDWSCRSQ